MAGLRRDILLAMLAAIAMIGLAPRTARGQADRWLDPDSPVRRILTCTPATTGLPGDDVAVVTFYTAGKAKPGGDDVRVFAETDPPRLVPHRVLMAGPGDRLRIAFATPKGIDRYHLYYGNPKAAAPLTPLDIRRGLLYETRTTDGAAAAAVSVKQVAEFFSKGRPQGAAFVDNIFFGCNPFGESENFVSHFTGWLDVKKPGAYRLATTSDDCSFLLIDDKPVVEWPGSHGAVADARNNAAVSLTAGLHKLTYWHGQGGGGCVAEAAWLPPGETRYVVIPKEAFAPVAEASLADVQFRGRRITPDFDEERAGETFVGDFYPVRVHFRNLTAFEGGKANASCEWDFGDGQTSRDAEPDHVYLRHGTYAVRLTVTWGPQSETIVNHVLVERNWSQQGANRIEPLARYTRVMAAYDLSKLDGESLEHAADIFAAAAQSVDELRALEVLVFKARSVAEAVMLGRTARLVELYREAKRPDDAVRACARAESQVVSVDAKARMAIAGAMVRLRDQGRPDEAERELRRAVKSYARASALVRRDMQIGLGDVLCRRGDRDGAAKEYAEAEKMPLGGLAEKNPTLRKSSLARYVAEYTRTRDFTSAEEFLGVWYREFPSERIRGEAPLAEARLRLAQENHGEAVRVAGELVGVNRESPVAADILMVGAEAALKLFERDRARAMLSQILDDYPEYGRRADVEKMLKELGGRASD